MSSPREGGLGLSCTEDGLFLGHTALVERHGERYAVRSRPELDRLLARAYDSGIAFDRMLPGLRVVFAAALDQGNLCLAQIAAVQLWLPDLPDDIVRGSLETEDRLIKAGHREEDRLARSGWDEDKHPRAGVPPNPGWFAPLDGGQAPTQTAQSEEDERAPEEMSDPTAPLRQAQWDAAIASLRQIDPANPHLTYFANPGAAPSEEALDRLNAAVEAAAIKRVTDKVMPGDVPIGVPGTRRDIRELPGGLQSSKRFFQYLRVGGQTIESPNLEGTLVKLPGNAGYITFRAKSASGPPAIDVNLPGIFYMKIHFR